MEITELATERFKVVKEVHAETPNKHYRMSLTVGQYEPVHFSPQHLDELIHVLIKFREINEGVKPNE